MSLFYSYIARDILEVEPVYFPEQVCIDEEKMPQHKGTTVTSSSVGTTTTTIVTSEENNNNNNNNNGKENDNTLEMDGHLSKEPYRQSFYDILMHRLTERYVGKIVPAYGLCVAINEIMQYTRGVVRGSSASAWLSAQFRLCIFAPTPGARLRAVISAQNRNGIFLSLDFFQFIFFVPGELLVSPSFFHEEKNRWALQVEGDEEEEEETTAGTTGGPELNFYENGDEVIVRVERVTVREPVDLYNNIGAKGANGNGGNSNGTNKSKNGGVDVSFAAQSPMEIVGSFVGTGLGPVLWFEG